MEFSDPHPRFLPFDSGRPLRFKKAEKVLYATLERDTSAHNPMDSELDLAIEFERMLTAVLIQSPDQATREQAYLALMRAEKPAFPPLEALPCANVQSRPRSACDGLGKKACSGCRLVSYCSEVRHLLLVISSSAAEL
jgi:hypothetical protein